MKIHLIPAHTQGQKHDQVAALLKLWELSDRRHSIVSTPEAADLCLVCNISGPGWYAGLRNHPYIKARPERCFVVHDGDIAMPLLHGIYTSAKTHMNTFRRFRSGAYNLFPPSTRNPCIEDHNGKAYLDPKKHLVSFWGQDSSSVRKGLFQLPAEEGVEIINTTGKYSAFVENPRGDFQKGYFESLRASKFALCPRGTSPSSIRLFEAMKMGVAPIIVSDAQLLPSGPDWGDFALFVPENRIGEIGRIAAAQESSYQERGHKARTAYEMFFSDEVYFNYLVRQMVEIGETQLLPERVFWFLRNLKVEIFRRQESFSKN